MPKRTAKTAAAKPADLEAEVEELETLAARRRRARRELDADPDELEEVEVPLGGDAEVVAKVLADLDGAGSFTIYRLVDGKAENVGQYPITEDWENVLRDEVDAHGDGSYMTRFRDENGRVVKSITRKYKARPKANAPAPADGGLQSVLLAMLQTEKERAAQAQTEAREARIEAARQQAETNKLIIETMRAGSGSIIKELTPLVAALAPVFSKMMDRESPLDSVLETLEVMKELKSEQEPSGTLDRVIAAVLPAAAPAITAAMGAVAGSRLRRAASKPATLPAPAQRAPASSPAAAPASTQAQPPKPGAGPIETTAVPTGDPAAVGGPAYTPRKCDKCGQGPFTNALDDKSHLCKAAHVSGGAAVPPPAAEVPAPNAAKPSESEMKFPLIEYVPQVLESINAGHKPEDAAQATYDALVDGGKESVLFLLLDNGDWDGFKADPRISQHAEWIDAFHAKLEALSEEEEKELAAEPGNQQ